MSHIEAPHPLPSGEMVALMTGTVAPTVRLVDNAGIQREVNLITEGAGIAGVEHMPGNKYGGGILNHVLLAARLAEHIAYELRKRGILDAHPDTVQDSHLGSHNGRLPHDQARDFWSPGTARDEMLSVSNEAFGVRMLEEAGAPSEIIALVTALAYGVRLDPKLRASLDYKIAIYADHIVDQHVYPLYERMGTFFLGNLVAKGEREEKRERVVDLLRRLIAGRKSFVHSEPGLPADQAMMRLSGELSELRSLVSWNSGRLSFDQLMQFIMEDAEFEASLERLGIEPAKFTDDNLPMRRWEAYIRRLSLNAAEEEIFEAISALKCAKGHRSWVEIENDADHPLWQEFPRQSWWGAASVALYRKQKGKPYHSKKGKPDGMKRAVWFFSLPNISEKLEKARRKPQEVFRSALL